MHQEDTLRCRGEARHRQRGGAQSLPAAKPLQGQAPGLDQGQVSGHHQQRPCRPHPGLVERLQVLAADGGHALRRGPPRVRAFAVGPDEEHPCAERTGIAQALGQRGRGPLALRGKLGRIQGGPEQRIGHQLEGEWRVPRDDIRLQGQLVGICDRGQRCTDLLHRSGDLGRGAGATAAGEQGGEQIGGAFPALGIVGAARRHGEGHRYDRLAVLLQEHQAQAIRQQRFLGAGQGSGRDRGGGGRLRRQLGPERDRKREQREREQAGGGHRAASGVTMRASAFAGTSQAPATRRRSPRVTAWARATSVFAASGDP